MIKEPKSMNKSQRELPVIMNKKLFEKQLQKTQGFAETNRSFGIDSRAMIFIPNQQILVVAGLHEQNEKPQQLTLYKIDATVDKSNKSGRFLDQKRGSQSKSKGLAKKRNSAIYSYSKTSLVDNIISKKEIVSDKSKNKSGQSSNVGKKTKENISNVILETDEDFKGNIFKKI